MGDDEAFGVGEDPDALLTEECWILATIGLSATLFVRGGLMVPVLAPRGDTMPEDPESFKEEGE